MGYAVGVDLGSTMTTVALARGYGEQAPITESEWVALTIPSVVYLGENGEMAVGEQAEILGLENPHRIVRDFRRRLGDSVPIIVDEWSERAESLIASLVSRVVERVAKNEGRAADLIAVTHPAHWGEYKKALLANALAEVGLADAILLSEPTAAVANAVVPAGDRECTVVVYDLGGTGFSATLVTRRRHSESEILGGPEGLEFVGGDYFDQAVFSRVRSSAALHGLDGSDRDVLPAVGRLRQACTTAKESLSLDTEATIAIVAPLGRTRVRVVRSEFEELIRDGIEDTLEATHRVIDTAGLAPTDIQAIVLVGGSSRIPLVAQMISAEFALPIVVGTRPDCSIALGAAKLAARAVQARRATLSVVVPVPQVAAIPTPELVVVPVTEPEKTAAEDETPAPDVAPAVPNPNREPTRARPAPRDRGRHRHRSRRRFGWTAVGAVASLVTAIIVGSSLSASEAADTGSPSSRSNGGRVEATEQGSHPNTTAPSAQVTSSSSTAPGEYEGSSVAR